MMPNTSIHNLNADNGLSKIGKAVWMLLNLINNNYFPDRSKELCVDNFCPELDDEDWQKINIKSTPSRSLSDLFWLKIDWKTIKSELGSINVFDTGAGDGGYALKLNDFAEGISTYFGTDLAPRKEWEDIMLQHDFVTVRRQHSHDILNMVPQKTNFFMSQSAIEHFENDLLFFDQIRNFIDKTRNNTIQVHLFPSAACLMLFRSHGVRQYTPRTISKIAELFNSKNSYSILFRLGGKNCNDLHRRFITYPFFAKRVDWRDSKTEEYRTLLKNAIENDIACKNYQPNFYALVIHSNFKKPIFKTMEKLTCRCPCS